jgi:hypothetical protein
VSESVVDIILKCTNQTKRALREPIDDLSDLGGALKGAMPLWGGMAAAAGAAALIMGKAAIDAGDAAFLASQKIGMSAESYTALAFAAGEFKVPAEDLDKSLKKFSQGIEGAATGNDKMVETFKALGVSVTDASGKLRPTGDILNDVANAFQKLPDGAGKANMAVTLFGKAGLSMVPMLNEGADGLKEMAAKADSLGQVLSTNFAAGAHAFAVTMDDIKKGTQGWANGLTAQVLPALQILADDIETAVAKGGLLYNIVMFLGTGFADLVKHLASAYIGVRWLVDILTTAVPAAALAAYQAITFNFKASAQTVRDALADISKSTEKSSQDLDKIWGNTQTGPKVDVPGHKKDLEEILAADQAAKQKQDEMDKEAAAKEKILHDQALAYYRTAPLVEIQAKIAALKQKETLNAQELQDLGRLTEDEKAMRARIDAAMATNYKKMTRDMVNDALAALPPIEDMNDQQLTSYTRLIKEQERLDTEQKEAKKAILGELVKLSSSTNSTLAFIGKQAAAAQATMDTYAAAAKALDSAPYPYNLVLAGITVVAGMAYVGQIEGIQGFEDGGMVGGSSYSGDKTVVKANAGEIILTRAMQSSLAQQLTGNSGGGGGTMVVNVGAQKLFDIIVAGFKDGRLTVPQNAVRAR